MDESLFQNIVRIGKVYDIDNEKHKARVHFPRLNMTSGWLCIVRNAESWMPSVNDTVLCLYFPVFNGDGYILGVIE